MNMQIQSREMVLRGVAQSGSALQCITEGVRGSNPLTPTTSRSQLDRDHFTRLKIDQKQKRTLKVGALGEGVHPFSFRTRK